MEQDEPASTYDEQVVGEDDRLGKVEDERLDQGHLRSFTEAHLGLLNLAFRLEFFVAGELSEPSSSSVENVLRRGLFDNCSFSKGLWGAAARKRSTDLRHGDNQEEKSATGKPQHDPESPSPAFSHNGETRNNRTKTGTWVRNDRC